MGCVKPVLGMHEAEAEWRQVPRTSTSSRRTTCVAGGQLLLHPRDALYNSWLAADAVAAFDMITRLGSDRVRSLAACETDHEPDAGRFVFGEVQSLWMGGNSSELIINYADGRVRLLVANCSASRDINSPMRRLYLGNQ